MITEIKIAFRYIFSRHSFNFITIINILSLIGIIVGVSALIIVISMFNAFQDIAIKQIVGFDPHIQISDIPDNSSVYNKINNFLKIIVASINSQQFRILELCSSKIIRSVL